MDLREILVSSGLNTLMFTDPYAKVCFTSLVASSFEKAVYVDLDTTFSAYLNAGMISPSARTAVLLPTEGRLVPLLEEAIAQTGPGSVVIFDSVNSFYTLFPVSEKRLGSLNHLLSVALMLLVKRGREEGAPVLATSMLRYRQAGGWVQSPASRRLLQNKSAARMRIEIRDGRGLVLTIVDHPSIRAGSELVMEAPVTA